MAGEPGRYEGELIALGNALFDYRCPECVLEFRGKIDAERCPGCGSTGIEAVGNGACGRGDEGN